jgi:opacity protein-like surface antigen
MIAVDVGGFMKDFVDSRIQLFYLVVEGHWFPGGGGLFVRGGAGYGSLQLTLKTPAIEFPSFTQGGFNWGAGLGYELRVSDSVAIGLAYDYRYFNLGDNGELGYTDVRSILQQLTFQVQLYFI